MQQNATITPEFDRRQFGLDAFKPYLKRWAHLACEPDFGFQKYFWPNFSDVEKDYFHKKVKVTPEQAEAIINEPQGTEAWLDHRFWRISMSVAHFFLDSPESESGSLEEHMQERYDSIDGEGKRKTGRQRRVKNKKMMLEGHTNEPLARAEIMKDLILELRELVTQALDAGETSIHWHGFRFVLPETIKNKRDWTNDELLTCRVRGLKVVPHLPFLGASSDGELTVFGIYDVPLLEIKCPSDPKKLGLNVYLLPKLAHFFQTQGCMYAHDERPLTFYMVRAVQRYTLETFMYDPELCHGYLLPNWTNAYCSVLFPQLVKRVEIKRIESLALKQVLSVDFSAAVPKKNRKRKDLSA